VIIARTNIDEDRFEVTNPDESNFVLGLPLTVGGQPLILQRGWATVDERFRGKWIRFANTHLEAYSDVIRRIQALELVWIL
jgi:hypothetical protein